MGKEIANEDFVVTITPDGTWTPGTPRFSPVFAMNAKANDKKIVIKKIEWIMLGCSNPQGSLISGGSQISLDPIAATAQKVKCDGKQVVRVEDAGSCKGTQSTSGSNITCTCQFEISNAGQDKVKGE